MENKGLKRDDRFETISDMIRGIKKEKYDLEAMSLKFGDIYQKLTFKNLKNDIESISTSLVKMGIRKGDRVGILSENRTEWPIAYLAICSMGAVVVPLDIFLQPDQLKKAISASGLRMIFVSGFHIDNIFSIKDEIAGLTKVICFDIDEKRLKYSGNFTESQPETHLSDKIEFIEHEEVKKDVPFNDYEIVLYLSMKNIGRKFINKGYDLYSKIIVKPDDVAAMIFAKGSTFAMLTHNGLMANVYGLINFYRFNGKYINPGDKWLASVPFHHSYPVMLGILLPIITYGKIVIQTDFQMEDFIRTLDEEQIDYMPTVPILVENLFKTIKAKDIKFENLKFIISGGAPIHKKIIDGMSDLGITVYQGYGLTEYTPVVSSNFPDNNKPGSVGPVIMDAEVKIENPDMKGNGELLVKGPSIMKGYYKEPELTDSVIDKDGWLHTGDVARIDDEGFIYITGRIRKIVVNKGGKNIYTEDIEKELLKSKYISQIVVMPKLDPLIGEHTYAIIHPDFEAVSTLEKEKDQRMDESDLRVLFKDIIKEMASRTAYYNKVKDFEISYKKIPVESMMKKWFMFDGFYMEEAIAGKSSNTTPSLKLMEKSFHKMDEEEKKEYLLSNLCEELKRVACLCFKLSINDIEFDTDIGDVGFDSIGITAFANEINETFNLDLNPFLFLEYSSIKEASDYIYSEYQADLIKHYTKDSEVDSSAVSKLKEVITKTLESENNITSGEKNKVKSQRKDFAHREGELYFMGIDAGSTTIKTVILNDQCDICHSTYERSKPGKGKPAKCAGNCEKCGLCSLGSLKNVVTNALSEISLSMENIANIIVTGSQITEETKNLIPYDAHVSEVTAHVAGALNLYPDCNAILDVGGQDSKSMIYDSKLGIWQSKMSGICAAGTGAFLDNVAAKLEVAVEDMEDVADYNSTLDFSSVCAVFAATSINKYKNRYPLSELIGGACAAQARTVMSGVGDVFSNYKGTILFQGGVAANKVVAHYLHQITGNEIIVPENYQVMGAYGAAILAKEHSKIKPEVSHEPFFSEDDLRKKSITMRSKMVIKDFFGNKDKPLVWRNLFYPVEILNALDCRVFTLESRAALAAQNRKEIKKSLDKAMYKGYGAETCSFLRVLEGMDLPQPAAGVSTSQPCQQGERILRDLVVSNGKEDSFYSLNTPIDMGPSAVEDLAADIERSIYCLEKSLGRKMDINRLEEAFEYSNQAREISIENNHLRYTSPPLIAGQSAINFANILSQGWGTKEFVDIQNQLNVDLLEQKHKLEGKVDINDTHRIMWLHLSPFYNTDLMNFIENTCNAPIIMEEVNFVQWSPLDIKDPYTSLSRKILDAGFLNMESRIKLVVEQLQKSRANGCILYNHMFGRCALSDITVIRYLRSALNEIGIPLLVLDGDCIDPTIDPCSTYTKVQSYTEALNYNKYNNTFGIASQPNHLLRPDMDSEVLHMSKCNSCNKVA